ncbi:glycosyltransferase family 2 protein [Psychroserpens sp. XS_ASV72]|uniref:glycosyltransferase family 2 protein n=1 Tax=Psychroserpens sp. XS_ASV72 TaxID=3241293 RepID=UPI003517520E
MAKPLVSIILPNYNHAPYLEERLDSIINQTYSNFELIILDDNSSDESLEILKRFENHDKVSHFIINAVNSGSPFKQWQKGLNLVKGDYVWIAESDDKVDYNFLESQIDTLLSNDCDIVVAETLKFNNDKGVYGEVNHPIFNRHLKQELILDDVLYCPILNVNASVFKANLISKAKTFATYNIIGDRVFYHEAFFGKMIVQNMDTKAFFRKSEDSVSALDHRSLSYYKNYFYEHIRFLNNINETTPVTSELHNQYVKKFFNRVRYRLSRSEKLNFTFLKMYLKFRQNLKGS